MRFLGKHMGNVCGRWVVFLLLGCGWPLLAAGQEPDALVRKGDKAHRAGDGAAARSLYSQALAQQPDHAYGNLQMGSLHLAAGQPREALPYLRKAHTIAPDELPELSLLLAEAYHRVCLFDSAAAHYHHALRATSRKDYDQQDLIRKRLQECAAGADLLQREPRAAIQNLGEAINSPFADHVPVLADRGETLIFTSRRAGPAAGKGKQKEVNEKVYYARRQASGWDRPQAFAAPVNGTSHSSVVAVSADGQEMYVYKAVKRGGLYLLRKTPAGNWGEPVALDEPFNSSSFDPSLSISDDGEYAFFASDRDGGMGGLDIYVTFRQRDGSWSEAMNLGPAINTPYDEDAPFIDSRNNVLYFSSRGHDSMGGYDVFKSRIDGALWSQAENLGMPVNTPFDDIYFVMLPDDKHGYLSSDRPGGLGEKDIYLVTLGRAARATDSLATVTDPVLVQEPPAPTEAPEQLTAAQTAPPETAPAPVSSPAAERAAFSLRGSVTDAATGQPIAASISLLDPETRGQVAHAEADSLRGSFVVALEPNKAYEVQASKPGYFLYAALTPVLGEKQQDGRHTVISLRKIEVGANMVLHNILFEFNKLAFKPEALPELERLHTFLAQNPDLRIEISGHTDNRGSEQANQRISEQRAQAVQEYLVDRGISPDRIRAKGYGLSRPIAPNDTEEGRQRNRRTEFAVLSR